LVGEVGVLPGEFGGSHTAIVEKEVLEIEKETVKKEENV